MSFGNPNLDNTEPDPVALHCHLLPPLPPLPLISNTQHSICLRPVAEAIFKETLYVDWHKSMPIC